jgi:hypothetical protein
MKENDDIFGLSGNLGQAKKLSPLWGAVAGTGLGTIGAIGARQFGAPGGALERNSEWVGFGLGAAASGALLLSKKMRSAGWTGLAAAFLNNGLRGLEGLMFSSATSGPVIRPVTAFMNGGQGLGMAEMRPTGAFLGAHGDAPQLLGTNIAQGSQQVQLLGKHGDGPQLDSHAGHWGATHFSSR